MLGLLVASFALQQAEARVICTVVADAGTEPNLDQLGNCSERVTPASTFKIAISLMGFDSGFLTDEHSPTLPYKEGYVDWGGSVWRQPQDPASWIKYSVVWFSQQVASSLGEARFQTYAHDFQYGNADVSGDPGKHNGLQHAWISSSLKISPLEQVAFLKKLVNRQLPVSQHAFDMTSKITQISVSADGWEIHGKTGTAFPRDAAGGWDEAHGYGWFVGWASKTGNTLVFAHLIQDDQKGAQSAGMLARDELLKDLPQWLALMRH